MALHPRRQQNADTGDLCICHSAAGRPVTAAHPPVRQYPDTVGLRIAHAGREAR